MLTPVDRGAVRECRGSSGLAPGWHGPGGLPCVRRLHHVTGDRPSGGPRTAPAAPWDEQRCYCTSRITGLCSWTPSSSCTLLLVQANS